MPRKGWSGSPRAAIRTAESGAQPGCTSEAASQLDRSIQSKIHSISIRFFSTNQSKSLCAICLDRDYFTKPQPLPQTVGECCVTLPWYDYHKAQQQQSEERTCSDKGKGKAKVAQDLRPGKKPLGETNPKTGGTTADAIEVIKGRKAATSGGNIDMIGREGIPAHAHRAPDVPERARRDRNPGRTRMQQHRTRRRTPSRA